MLFKKWIIFQKNVNAKINTAQPIHFTFTRLINLSLNRYASNSIFVSLLHLKNIFSLISSLFTCRPKHCQTTNTHREPRTSHKTTQIPWNHHKPLKTTAITQIPAHHPQFFTKPAKPRPTVTQQNINCSGHHRMIDWLFLFFFQKKRGIFYHIYLSFRLVHKWQTLSRFGIALLCSSLVNSISTTKTNN